MYFTHTDNLVVEMLRYDARAKQKRATESAPELYRMQEEEAKGSLAVLAERWGGC
jgi:hypothetical protein